MSYFIDEYIKLNGDRQDFGTFTGKPLILGGSLGRDEATGFGVVITTKYVAKKIGLDLKNSEIGLQGFGNVGSYTLKYLIKEGQRFNIFRLEMKVKNVDTLPFIQKMDLIMDL